mgnify:CR=1 FL=1
MTSIIRTEFYKMKRYSVIWIGVATMFTVVLLARFMATASDGATHTLVNFSSSVIWNNLVLIYPATIALIAGYIIDRERTDDTLKNILTIPVSFRKMLIGKLIAVGCMAVALSVIEFLFTLIVFFASGFPGFSIGGMVQVLFQMIGINMISYIAVMPIIAFAARIPNGHMIGTIIAFVYGYGGMFASGDTMLANIYPVTASLGLISYRSYDAAVHWNVLICLLSMIVAWVMSAVFIFTTKGNVPVKIAKKHKKTIAKKGW